MTRPSAPQRPRSPAGRKTPDGPAGRGGSRWRAFTARFGWRAYALPLLAAVTLVAIVNAGLRGHSTPSAATGSPSQAGPSASAGNTALSTSVPSSPPVSTPRKPSSPAVQLRSWQLPPGPAYTFNGTGSFTVIPGSSGVLGKGQLFRFTIDIENGIGGVDPKAFAAAVMSALSDQRSWIGSGQVALQRVESGPVDFRISLAAPSTVRNVCGYTLKIETSCNAGNVGRVMLNVSRWTRGAVAYAGNLTDYHRYAVNHEVGHALGHNHAHECLGNGMAPVMMQQTIGVKVAGGRSCRPNPWPFPAGVSDAPGAEQAGEQPDAEFFQRNS